MQSITITNQWDEEITISVGDVVFFKSDIEQGGRVEEIIPRKGYLSSGGYDLRLSNPDGFPGEYLRYATETIEPAEICSKS